MPKPQVEASFNNYTLWRVELPRCGDSECRLPEKGRGSRRSEEGKQKEGLGRHHGRIERLSPSIATDDLAHLPTGTIKMVRAPVLASGMERPNDGFLLHLRRTHVSSQSASEHGRDVCVLDGSSQARHRSVVVVTTASTQAAQLAEPDPTLQPVVAVLPQRVAPKVTHAAAVAAQSKQSRRNTAKQVQAAKRHALVTATRVFGGVDGAPRVVAIAPLTEDVDAHAVARAVVEAVGVDDEAAPKCGLWRIRAERFKTALQFIQVPYGRTYTALDAAKAADYVVLALSPSIEVPPAGDTLLRALQAQGLPSILAVVAPGFPPDPRTCPGILKSLLSFVRCFVPDQARVFDLNAPLWSIQRYRV
ncbi:hypothetical protein K488DRAFT_75075 [Vararia minispora EC-137]|uniref:Uncharacterized protein n=1 Tax=Vararia minispora EC-137 TaxID=1314806 RepID=A0ACB8Q583_9AGAM|nr:hypothetical protein K488DRAFT_75075 [Vararia minispora EC-137]